MNMDVPDLSKYVPEMDITKKYVFLDTACVAPISNKARDAIVELAKEMAEHGPVFQEKWTRICQKTRVYAARILHCDSHEIAFVKNTSEGIGHIANGYPFQPGDNVVITGIEFPANRYPWMELKKKGVTVTVVPDEKGRVPTESLLAAISDNTRLVSISSVQFSSGFRHDLKAIGDYCRQRDIFFFVDIIQSMGVLDINVKDLGISAASADGHKWLVGPEGIGIMYISEKAQTIIPPTQIGWFNFRNPLDFLSYDSTFKDDASKYESGSLNTLGIFALNASLGLLLEIGVPNIEQHALALSDYLCEGLVGKGYALYSSRLPDGKSPIVIFYSDSMDSEEIHDILKQKNIITTCRNGRIRAAIHFFNTKRDIDKLIEALPDMR